MDFFSDCTTEAQRKERFRKLAKCFHPDHGGISEFMMELQKQWEHDYQTPIDYYSETIRPSYREIREDVQRNIEARIRPLKEYIVICERAIELKNSEIEELKKLMKLKNSEIEELKKLMKLKKKSLWERILFVLRGEVPNNYSIK